MLVSLLAASIAVLLGLLPAAMTGCDGLPDVCAYQRFVAAPPPTATGAALAITAMGDPVVRSAAVTRWLAVHPHVGALEAGGLCGLLAPAEQRSCLRRVSSPHLRR